MIYFDSKKNAYGDEIPNYICKINDEEWEKYAGTDKWDIINGVFIDISNTPEYKEKEQEQEQERINNLTMTPLDFIKVLEGLGLTISQVNAFLETHLDIKMQLTYCNSVYCGVVKSFLPIEIEGKTITAEMVEAAFKAKNGVE